MKLFLIKEAIISKISFEITSLINSVSYLKIKLMCQENKSEI